MSQDSRTFLNRSQAVDAIAADFSQYGPQPGLLLEIAPVILGDDVRTGDVNTDGWVKIRHGSSRAFEPVDMESLAFYIIHLLETDRTTVEVLARICSLVFKTAVWPGEDEGETGVWVEDQMNEFECQRCGSCCRGLQHVCTPEDLNLWERHGREDILCNISAEKGADGKVKYRIRTVPEAGMPAEDCPFLAPVPGKQIFRCRIQTVKPLVCLEYPLTRKHARLTGCPGFQLPLAENRSRVPGKVGSRQ